MPLRNAMPDFIREALISHGLMDAYLARPSSQQDDDIEWINQAKPDIEKLNRLEQMLDELEHEDNDVTVGWNPRAI